MNKKKLRTICIFFTFLTLSCNASSNKNSEENVIPPVNTPIKEATASSELASKNGKYSVKNLFNANWTSWVEGSEGDGSSESISLILEKPTSIKHICIKNGFGNLAYYWTNNRPKEIELTYDGKDPFKYTLLDTPLPQYININRLDKLISTISIKILSVYKGSDPANDCAIDEIAINSDLSQIKTYGTNYDSETVSYTYDPETQAIIKELYSMDVGPENVFVKDGRILVRYTDYEIGETCFSAPNFSLSGIFFENYYPGTGGGHSYDNFNICLNPSGEHYLFTWHNEGYGIFEYFPPNLSIYSWKNKKWNKQTNSNHSDNLSSIFELITFIDNNCIFDCYANEDVFTLVAYPKYNIIDLPVSMTFYYDEENGSFGTYKKTVTTELAFGSIESLTSINDWKSELEKLANSDKYNIFSYPAAYNNNPQMVKFLTENGFKIESQYKNHRGELENYKYTVLEAWQAGSNTKEVKNALIEAGASYSFEMINNAFLNRDFDNLKDLLSLIKIEERKQLLDSIAKFYFKNFKNELPPGKDCLDYIKTTLLLLKENGIDWTSSFIVPELEHKEQISTLMESAFDAVSDAGWNFKDPTPLLNLFISMGIKLPENTVPVMKAIEVWNENYFSEDYETSEEDKRKRLSRIKGAKDLITYLLAKGVSINNQDSEGNTVLHYLSKGGYISEHDIEVIEYLLSLGADINITNNQNQTALMNLLKDSNMKEKNDSYVLDLFLNENPDLAIKDNFNYTTLSYYVSNDVFNISKNENEEIYSKNLKYLTRFLEMGAEPNCIFKYNCYDISPLSFFAYSRNLEACNLLLDYGADPNFGDGVRAVYETVSLITDNYNNEEQFESYKNLLKRLLENGADTSYSMKYYEPPLLLLGPINYIYGTEEGNQIFELLLDYGAANNLDKKTLKKAGFKSAEIKYILSRKNITETNYSK